LEFESRYVVAQCNMNPMEAGNSGDKAETEPVSGSAATLFKPIKALEDMLIFIDGNSRTVVGNRNDGTAGALFDFYGHLIRVTTIFDGVIDEIGHRIEKEVSISRGEHTRIPDNLKMPTLLFCGGIE
jgi:hypothetical protein